MNKVISGTVTLDHDLLGRLLMFGVVLAGDVKIQLRADALEAARETVEMANRLAHDIGAKACFEDKP